MVKPLQAPSAAEAARRCSADPACRGFNDGGYYKRTVTPIITINFRCLYVKQGTTTSEPEP